MLSVAAPNPLPRGPVLGWSSWLGPHAPGLPALDDAPHQCPTTSGRAAIVLSLKALGLPPQSPVLLPSYHCPTMAAAVVHAGMRPVFYALDERLQPDWARWPVDPSRAGTAGRTMSTGAVVCAHYFGMGRSLARERQWCDEHGWALIEDCAHTWFGMAGPKPVGSWGDYAIGSTTKFFPVREGGLLVSTRRPCPSADAAGLRRPGWVGNLRTGLGQLAQSHRHRRLRPLSTLPGWAERWVGAAAPRPAGPPTTTATIAASTTLAPACDMGRVEQQAWASSEWLRRHLPRARLVQRRRRIAQRLAEAAKALPGLRTWSSDGTHAADTVPYVLPLWVEAGDQADRAYQALRRDGIPVFRWDDRWPGASSVGPDTGALASRHLLQLPTHPDYTEGDLERIATAMQRCMGAST